jgi:hypothetical protein
VSERRALGAGVPELLGVELAGEVGVTVAVDVDDSSRRLNVLQDE